ELDRVTALDADELHLVLDDEAHRHRRPFHRRDRAVVELDEAARRVDGVHLAAALVQRLARRRRSGLAPPPGPRERAAEARLGVDQELARHDDLVARLQPPADLGVGPGLHADLDFDRAEPALGAGEDHHAPLTGANHRLARDEQTLAGAWRKR